MPQTLAGTPPNLSNSFIRQGRSFSGGERNCCFLNTGSGRFANISAVSGADFDDDARALGIVDWDFDGDLDVWAVNRTGPQVRFLRNDLPPGDARHFLALKLRGTNQGAPCNRDAIGARVEVYLRDQDPPLVQTLRAGDGFLSQSSKWLHFGLGTASRIARVVVRWPGGKPQAFTGLEADRWYRLVQGAPQADPWVPPRPAPLEPRPLPRETAGEAPRVLLGEPVPLPRVEFVLSRGGSSAQPGALDQLRGRPVLICLWASWCEPCVAELGELSDRHDELTAKGLTVLALSVDGLYDQRTTPRDAAELLARLRFRFPAGASGPTLLDRVQFVHDALLDRQSPFGLPCSFLIDAEGRLAAIYRGPVNVETALEDVGRLALTGDERRAAALPFSGRWDVAPVPPQLLPIARKLLQQGGVDEAWQYVSQNKAIVRQEPDYPLALLDLGRQLLRKGDVQEATIALNDVVALAPRSADAHFALGEASEARGDQVAALRHFQQAAALDPKHAEARQCLAWLLATTNDPSLRHPSLALRWAQDAVKLTGENDPSHLDTLAVTLAAVGEFARAIELEQRALRLAGNDQELVQQIKSRLEKFQKRQPIVVVRPR